RPGLQKQSWSRDRRAHFFILKRLGECLAAVLGISIRVGWRRRNLVAFGLQLLLDFLDRTIKLLVFAVKFLPWIIVHDDIRIDPVPFDDPLLTVFGVNREFRFEELPTINQR